MSTLYSKFQNIHASCGWATLPLSHIPNITPNPLSLLPSTKSTHTFCILLFYTDSEIEVNYYHVYVLVQFHIDCNFTPLYHCDIHSYSHLVLVQHHPNHLHHLHIFGCYYYFHLLHHLIQFSSPPDEFYLAIYQYILEYTQNFPVVHLYLGMYAVKG